MSATHFNTNNNNYVIQNVSSDPEVKNKKREYQRDMIVEFAQKLFQKFDDLSKEATKKLDLKTIKSSYQFEYDLLKQNYLINFKQFLKMKIGNGVLTQYCADSLIDFDKYLNDEFAQVKQQLLQLPNLKKIKQRLQEISEQNAAPKDLWTACENGYVHVLQNQMLDKFPNKQTFINQKNANGQTPLHMACMYGHQKMVEYLIENNADIHSKDSDGYQPLHYAAQRGHRFIVEALLYKGAKPNAMGEYNRTPLHMAAYNGQLDVVAVLLQNDANVNALTIAEDGMKTPLHDALFMQHLDIVEILLNSPKIDFEKRDKNEKTVLAYAVERGLTQVIISIFCHSNWKYDAVLIQGLLKTIDHAEEIKMLLKNPLKAASVYQSKTVDNNKFFQDQIDVIDEHIKNQNFEDAIFHLLSLLPKLNKIAHEKSLTPLYDSVLKLLPHMKEPTFLRLADPSQPLLSSLLELSGDLHEKQGELALQLAECSLKLNKDPLKHAMSYYAKAIQIREKYPSNSNNEQDRAHLGASKIFTNWIHNSFINKNYLKEKMESIAQQKDLQGLENLLNQIEQLKRFCCEDQDKAVIRQLYAILEEFLNTCSLDRPFINTCRSFLSLKRDIFPKIYYTTQQYHEGLRFFRENFAKSSLGPVRNFQEKINEYFKDYFKMYLNDAMALLGPPPCTYDIRALGSGGKQERTPYSDIEYIILIEKDQCRDYFVKLANLLELQIISLEKHRAIASFLLACIQKTPLACILIVLETLD